MAELVLNFPTFYHCAIKNHTNLNQYNAISVLLLGEERKKDSAIYITDQDASNYISGKKRIRGEILVPLLKCSRKDLIDRLQRMGLDDVGEIVDALKHLLAKTVSPSRSILNNLIQENEDGEYGFIAAVFLTAIKYPAHKVAKLTELEKEMIEACYLEGPVSMGDEVEDDPASKGFSNTFQSVTIRSRKLDYLEDYHVVRDYLSPYFDAAALIAFDRANLQAFFLMAHKGSSVEIAEFSGHTELVKQQIKYYPLLNQCTAVLGIYIGGLNVSFAEVDKISASIQERCFPNAFYLTSIQYSDDLNAEQIKVILLYQHDSSIE